MKKSFLVWILIFLSITALLIAGCAHGRARRTKFKKGLVYASQKEPPSWITKIPEDKKYIYFVGSSPDVETLNEGKKSAIKDALRQVVATIGVKVSAESTQIEKYYAEKYQQEITTVLLEKGEARLQGAEVKEVYYEKYQKKDGSVFFRVWVLLKYSRESIKKEQERLQAVLKMRYGVAQEFESKAEEAEKNKEYFKAVLFRLDAAHAGLKLDEADVFFNRNISRAGILLNEIKLQKRGDGQKGWVGKPLEKPLEVVVFVEKEGKRYYQKGVPVRFLYRVPRVKSAGYKYLVSQTETNDSGVASFRVDKVYEVNDENIVEAELNLTPYLKKFKGLPTELSSGLKEFKKLVALKKVMFKFSSDTKARQVKTAVYILQTDVDSSLLPKPVTATEIYNILYRKRFLVKYLDIAPSQLYGKDTEAILSHLIRVSGKNTRRLIFGYVNITSYDKLSGFYVAQARADVKLYDTKTGNMIMAWRIERSGTGSNKEEAEIAVLEEVGRSIGEIASKTMP